MNHFMVEEIENAGGDPQHPTWIWFIEDGPHGNELTWGQTRENPPGYIGIDHLESVVSELSKDDKAFIESLKELVPVALHTNHPDLLQRGIQIAAAIGQISELDTIINLTNYPHDSVAKTARAGAFYLKRCSK